MGEETESENDVIEMQSDDKRNIESNETVVTWLAICSLQVS